jgi:2-dehydro-3-deoxyphosphooctonate aldolase (KDO 8-P synthase)
MTVATPHQITVGGLEIANDLPFTLIAGPCQLESRDHAMEMAEALTGICAELGIGLIYKASFDKANRTSLSGERGIGMAKGLPIMAELRDHFSCPVLTDVHEPWQCAPTAEVVDVLQIPAYLCRQTDLIVAAGETGKVVNVKKGQFLAPWDMKNIAAKLEGVGNTNIMLTERGVTFGYNTLVSDMRALPQMAETGYPVVFDAAARRSWRGQRWRATVRAGPCPGGAVYWRCGAIPGNPPGPGQRAQRWP